MQHKQADAIRQAIGNRIRSRRERLYIERRELADTLGMSMYGLYCIERGLADVSCERFVKIADALDITPARLLSGVVAAK